MADLYKPDGSITNVKPANGEAFTMDELNKHVSGYVEMVGTDYSDDNKLLYVIGNEDGKLLGLPTNRSASNAAGRHLVGDILFITEAEAAILLDTGDDDEDEANFDEDDDE